MKKFITVFLAALMLLNCTVMAEENEAVAAENGPTASTEAVNTDSSVPESGEAGNSEAALEDEYADAFNIYVDPKSEGEANTYRTISAAIAAAKGIDKSKQQVVVNIAGGSYRIADTLAFSKEDSGSTQYPVIYRAKNGEHVVLEAGEAVQGTVVTNKDSIYKKLPQSLRSKVYKINLSKHKTEELGNLDETGTNMGGQSTVSYGSIVNLIYNDTIMKMASYPNIGSEHIKTAVGGNQFSLENTDAPVKSWNMSSGNGWVQTIENNGYIYGQDYIKFADTDNYDFTYSADEKIKDISDFEYIDFSEIGIEKKQLGKTHILSPKNGAENVEGNCAVLSWRDTNGADRYRVRVYMYSDNTAMVYDKTVTGTSVELDNLKYGKTYYWNVEPIVSSKSEYGGIVSDTYSFKTAKTEKKSTDKLEETLDFLGDSWRRVKEGNKPGQYQPGAVAELDKTVTRAEDILYDGTSKMFSIKYITSKLNAAINKFNDSQNLEIVEMGDWLKDTANWSVGKGSKIENGSLYMLNDIAGYGGATLSRSQLLRMKIKLDFTNYQGFGLNQQDPSNVFWADTGYAVVIKRDLFEIQRYTDKSSGIIATFSNDESKLTSDVWYTIDVGLLSTPLGPRILLKTGDKVLIDYIDQSGEKADQLGYVSFQDGSGTMGMYVAGSDYTE